MSSAEALELSSDRAVMPPRGILPRVIFWIFLAIAAIALANVAGSWIVQHTRIRNRLNDGIRSICWTVRRWKPVRSPWRKIRDSGTNIFCARIR
jgi:hypothetical protein